MKEHLLWVGSFQSKKGYKESLVNNMGEASAYASQKGLIKGIDAIIGDDCVMDSINVVVNPAYPQYPEKVVKGYRWKRNNKSQDLCVGYHNIKYFNYLDRDVRIEKAIKEWGNTIRADEDTAVLVYSASIGKMNGALYLKKKYGTRVYVILPDIPDFVNPDAPRPVILAKRIASKRLRQSFEQVDGFIMYSPYMADYYRIPEEKWILMEGVFDPEEKDIIESASKRKDNMIRIMYCGTLDKRRSLPEILGMFSKLKDSEKTQYELWLVGTGDCNNLISECAKRDGRIKCLGFINSREKVLKLEAQADILLYTREIESEGACYSFPSKLFEYMMTGKPIACVRVPSISEEFFRYFTPIEEISARGIYEAVSTITSDYGLYLDRASEAKNFIMENKSSYVQGKRIMDFVRLGKLAYV